jgi:hypothetical protein
MMRQKHLPVFKGKWKRRCICYSKFYFTIWKNNVYHFQIVIWQSERTMFSFFRPFLKILFSVHIWSLRITRLVISGGIAAISCWISDFSSSVVLGLRLQTSAFRCPQRKKSHAARSGEHAGHGMSPRSEIRRPGNISRRTPMDRLAVWAVAPSCWNHTAGFPRSFSLGSRKLRNICT